MTKAIAIIFFLLLPVSAYADVEVNATGSCAMWLKAGKNKVFRQIQEAFVLGLLDGLSLGNNKNFWVTSEGELKVNQALSWVDRYCREKPSEHTITGVQQLFESRAEIAD